MIYKGEPGGVISLDNQKPFDWGIHKRLRKVSNPGIKEKFPSSIKKQLWKNGGAPISQMEEDWNIGITQQLLYSICNWMKISCKESILI